MVANYGGTPTPLGVGNANLTAWTVTNGPRGTVNVTIRQLLDPAGLERTLRADGIPANVSCQDGEPSDTPPLPSQCQQVAMSDEANANLQAKILGWPLQAPSASTGYRFALNIHRPQIPKGIGIYLAVQADSSNQQWGWGLDLVKDTPACTGSSGQPSSPAAS